MLTFSGQGTRLAFIVLTLERVTIRCCEVGGGSGGGGDDWLIGGVGVVCGDGVDSGVGDVVCGVVCSVVDGGQCIDIHDDCKRTDKDRWCGTRGKFVWWKGVKITKASKRAKRHQGDQDVDAKGNDYGIFINQSKYALESLKKYGYESCDPVDTPMVEKSKLDEDKDGQAVDQSHYRGMIGTLLYLTASRPDLQFAICMCARYQARPTEKH
nr:uncharacterized mitochondrial protein AtMg00810-like [Tanacetum cinerariifolium]